MTDMVIIDIKLMLFDQKKLEVKSRNMKTS